MAHSSVAPRPTDDLAKDGQLNRRDALRLGALYASFCVAGQWLQTSPAQAKALGFTPQVLSSHQLAQLSALADVLVPGASMAGVDAYIDAQLSAGADSLLLAKYVGVAPPDQAGFYGAIADAVARVLDEQTTIAELPGAMLSDSVPNWRGPPASYALFVLRADALDVTWGTQEGYSALDIPYQAHITPPSPW